MVIVSSNCGSERRGRNANLVLFDRLSCPPLVLVCGAAHLVLVQGKLALRCRRDESAGRLGERSGHGLALLPGRGQAGLRQLKVANGAVSVLVVLHGPGMLGLVLGAAAGPVGPLQLLLLRQDVREGALATEYVAAQAGHGLPRDAEAQAAGAKGQERVAAQARRARGPVRLGQRSLGRGEDGAGRVSLACEASPDGAGVSLSWSRTRGNPPPPPSSEKVDEAAGQRARRPSVHSLCDMAAMGVAVLGPPRHSERVRRDARFDGRGVELLVIN